jgi:hypothetical protein
MVVARKHRVKPVRKDTVCIQTCKRAFPGVKRIARFMNRDARQPALLIGSGVFRFQWRLTAFRDARNIIRIRTK